MKKLTLSLMLVVSLIVQKGCNASNDIETSSGWVTGSDENNTADIEASGWVIGWDENNTAVILHTGNNGQKWEAQGDSSKWKGYRGNDISAVNILTVWAAIGSNMSTGTGKILHTVDAGKIWTEQKLPNGVRGGIKGIKGLSTFEAWAVSIGGTVLHTTDGGKSWKIIDLGSAATDKMVVNRLDVVGNNVWIVDERGGDWGMIHTSDGGQTWRREYIPNSINESGGHMVSAYSSQIVWAAKWYDGTLYRTVNSGEEWENTAEVGPNDIDDMCAYSTDALWFVQYESSLTQAGNIYHLHLENGEIKNKRFVPVPQYKYEGITCFNSQKAIVVGYTDLTDSPQQRGIILFTDDGGKSWSNQPLPLKNVHLWKVSFVGAHR